MRLKIVQPGEPVLREAAQPLTPAEILDPSTRLLVEHMRDTMRDAPGVGLAAPQIGVGLQIAVIEDKPEYLKSATPQALAERERSAVPFFVLYNPRIVEYSGEQAEYFEGCLSVAGFSALVRRSRSVTVEYLDDSAQPRKIEASGWFARILQHEIDHLNGYLYLDRMETRSFATIENITRYWKDLPVQSVRDKLNLS